MTPEEGGAIAYLQRVLAEAGFDVHRVMFTEPGYDNTENLYARIGTGSPHFVFAGHTDVVPPGDSSSGATRRLPAKSPRKSCSAAAPSI